MISFLSALLGLNYAFWGLVGFIRLCDARLRRKRPASAAEIGARLRIADVAVVIPAYNEQIALPKCIRALSQVISTKQIYVASDGSKDDTVAIGRALGCQVLDIKPNGGKARALDRAIRHFDLCKRYRAILIQDADSEIDPGYFTHALPLFDDPTVVVVAGHVTSAWRPAAWPSLTMLYTAYRTRLYRFLQAMFQYGQCWKWTSVSYIAPGFASMYRTSILPFLDITAPGLVVEDFHMTFEVHRKKLGRVAYSPLARCATEDPFRLPDYSRQVLRWYLGFWQTIRRHGVWPGKFWLALGPLTLGLVLYRLFLLAMPLLLIAEIAASLGAAPGVHDAATAQWSPLGWLWIFLAADYALTVGVAIFERRPILLLYGLAFPILGLLDAGLFIVAAVQAMTVRSDGRWKSPERRASQAMPGASL